VAPEPAAPVVAPPVVGPVVPRPPVPGPVTVETVERAILETGLFRTTTVNFEFAKANLLPTSAATLDILADVLRRYPALRVEVGGHTDDRGSDATNDALSQRRAEAVRDYLVASGVAASRLSAVGYGERRPVATNANDTGRALNRRVEFMVLNPEAATSVRRSEAPAVRDVIREELDRLREDG
jgi:outer membrane protein OmpA-like peptidoglycan-associated protein